MTQEAGRGRVILPHDVRILDWSVQDTLDAIMGMEPDGEGDEALRDFLKGSTTPERLAASELIARNEAGHRHLIEAMVEEIIADSRERLKEIITAGQELPPPDETALAAVNLRRAHRNLVRIDVHGMADGRSEDTVWKKLEGRILDASLEEQEGIESAIQEALEEHAPLLRRARIRILSSIAQRLGV